MLSPAPDVLGKNSFQAGPQLAEDLVGNGVCLAGQVIGRDGLLAGRADQNGLVPGLDGGEVCDVHQGLVHADAPDDGGPAAAQQNLSAGQGAGQTVPLADGEHGHLGGALGHKRQPVSGAGAGGQGFDCGHPGMEGENRTQRRRSRVPILLGAEQAVESDPDPGVVP